MPLEEHHARRGKSEVMTREIEHEAEFVERTIFMERSGPFKDWLLGLLLRLRAFV